MVKRICDRCGKDLIDNVYIEIDTTPMRDKDNIYLPNTFDLCEKCYDEFKAFLCEQE